VLIAGVDAVRSKMLEQDLRQTLAQLPVSDVSTIALLPSDARGRWDLGVKRSNVWSVVWFDAAVDDLSTEVASNLRQSVALWPDATAQAARAR
jgi:hypothetical protein